MRETVHLRGIYTVLAASTFFFVAGCGDTVNEYNDFGMEVVSSVDDLPECTDENEGAQAVVNGESSIRVCIDGDWTAMSSTGYSCKTEELEDKSGLKILCNGDSIGVVLNGTDGKDGPAGETCYIAAMTESKVTIVCGDSTMVVETGGEAKSDTVEADSEKIAISLDSLVGYTQKGPFLKGTTVYLYELSDGRSLKQTNGNFMSVITRDDGRYKFTARDLVSQYAMLIADGYYRNEVTGKNSGYSIRLKALTDMRKHSSVNVNLLTHLEFDRVYHLVTRGDTTGKRLTVRQAKRQAQREILREFQIELGDNTDAEDMDVFGDSEADAALLALSVLLQGDRDETEMTVLLTEIANDIAEDGKWDGENADSLKAAIADWGLMQDSANTSRLAQFRQNVGNWGLSKTVPEFEKLVRNFVNIESGLGKCGSDSIPLGTVKYVPNASSKEFYAANYTDVSVSRDRFVCIDTDGGRWRMMTDCEKDLYGKHYGENTWDGELLTAPVSGRAMVWDADTLRYADSTESRGGKGCTSYNRDELRILDGQYSYYKCTGSGWEFTTEKLNNGTMTDTRDNQEYKTIGIGNQMWMAENLNYADSVATPSLKGKSWCYGDTAGNCTKYGRLYTWAAAIDSVKIATDPENPRVCGYLMPCVLSGTAQGVCPEGWHLPSMAEYQTLFATVGGNSTAGVALKSNAGWYNDFNGDDTFGFTALPAGLRNYSGTFQDKNVAAVIWSSSTGDNGSYANYIAFNYNRDFVNEVNNDKRLGLSVRCLRD